MFLSMLSNMLLSSSYCMLFLLLHRRVLEVLCEMSVAYCEVIRAFRLQNIFSIKSVALFIFVNNFSFLSGVHYSATLKSICTFSTWFKAN